MSNQSIGNNQQIQFYHKRFREISGLTRVRHELIGEYRMNLIIISVCFLVGFLICFPFYRKMLKVAKDMNADFSKDVEGRKGFNNGVHGNFFIGMVYVLMLPIFFNLLITFALYLLAQKFT